MLSPLSAPFASSSGVTATCPVVLLAARPRLPRSSATRRFEPLLVTSVGALVVNGGAADALRVLVDVRALVDALRALDDARALAAATDHVRGRRVVCG